jgi:predicted MPP superfamily phosphohydrolase
MLFGFLPLPASIKNFIGWISSHWIGIFFYLLMFFVFVDLVLLLLSVIKIIPRPIPKRICLGGDVLVIITTIIIVGYGIYHTNYLDVVSYDIQTKENSLQEDMNIVLVSDLHLGAVNSEKNLSKIVQGINDLKPDLVCIAGDIFNNDYHAIQDPARAKALFQSITARYGVYASLGNHDGGGTFEEMIGFLEQSKITLLKDEHVVIDDRLILMGRLDSSPIGDTGDWQRKEAADVMNFASETNLPIVVMDHNPGNINQYNENVLLVLSGHTHKGQIFPINFTNKVLFDVTYGYYKKNESSPHVIVTSGASTWGMPMRIGTNNEIVTITLHKSAPK